MLKWYPRSSELTRCIPITKNIALCKSDVIWLSVIILIIVFFLWGLECIIKFIQRRLYFWKPDESATQFQSSNQLLNISDKLEFGEECVALQGMEFLCPQSHAKVARRDRITPSVSGLGGSKELFNATNLKPPERAYLAPDGSAIDDPFRTEQSSRRVSVCSTDSVFGSSWQLLPDIGPLPRSSTPPRIYSFEAQTP